MSIQTIMTKKISIKIIW